MSASKDIEVLEQMSKFLRGKKTSLKNFTENFSKTPNAILHASGLTPVDKLILIELQSYALRPEYILAYTRMASDLKIDKSNLIERWAVLREKGYIFVTSNDRWSINYSLLNEEPVTRNSKEGSTDQSNHVSRIDPPQTDRLIQPNSIGLPMFDDRVTPPIEEENNYEDKGNKNKIEDEFLVEKKDSLTSASITADRNNKVKFTSIEDFEKYCSIDQMKEFQSMSLMEFVQSTEEHFDDSQYALQCKIHSLIKRGLSDSNYNNYINSSIDGIQAVASNIHLDDVDDRTIIENNVAPTANSQSATATTTLPAIENKKTNASMDAFNFWEQIDSAYFK